MPSTSTFDPFRRFRLRSNPVPTLPEEDSDESSPERDQPHVIHIPAPKNGRKSGERLVSIPENAKRMPRGAPDKFTEITLSLDKPSHTTHPERSSRIPSKSGVARCVLGSHLIFLPHVHFLMSRRTSVSNNFLAGLAMSILIV